MHSKMRPFVTDVTWSVCMSVCLLVTTINRARTAEPIEMRFGCGRMDLDGPNEVLCIRCEF